MKLVLRDFQESAIPKPSLQTSEAELQTISSQFEKLTLEIGCGVGWHPITWAKKNPDEFIFAIEHTKTKFEKFQNRMDRHPELKNIKALHTEAISWVTHTLPRESLSQIYLLYPNPEPQNTAKRWFRMPFMKKLMDTLKTGGHIILATNIQEYAEEAILWGTGPLGLSLKERTVITKRSDPELYPRTHFEKKYLDGGQTCWNLIFTKI